MTQKTQKELQAEKRAAALRENLKRRKAAGQGTPADDTPAKTEKK